MSKEWYEEDKSIVFYKESEPEMERCSNEEREIYGVDWKKRKDISPAFGFVQEVKISDEKYPIYAAKTKNRSWEYLNKEVLFLNKDKAIKYVNKFIAEQENE